MTDFTPAQLRLIDEHRDINCTHDWWDSTYDGFIELLAAFGIDVARRYALGTYKGPNRPSRPEIFFSGFCHQGDGAQFATDAFTIAGILRKGAEALRAPDPANPEDKGGAYHFLLDQVDKPASERWAAGAAVLALYQAVESTFAVHQLSAEHGAILSDAHIRVELGNNRYSHSGYMNVVIDPPDEDEYTAASTETKALCDAIGETEWWEGLLRAIADALHEDLEEEHDYQTSDEQVWEAITANGLDEEDECAAA